MISLDLMDGKRLQVVWASYGIPKRMYDARLETFIPQNESQKLAVEKCKDYAEEIDDIGLFIAGPVGTGKTHLAVASLYEIVKNNIPKFGYVNESEIYNPDNAQYTGLSCYFVSVVNLLNSLRNSYQRNYRIAQVQNTLWRVKTNDIVILDDIGAEKPSKWVEETLFDIIDVRYLNKRTTVFTSNCNPKELENNIGVRTTSRIKEMTLRITVDGSDYRARKPN